MDGSYVAWQPVPSSTVVAGTPPLRRLADDLSAALAGAQIQHGTSGFTVLASNAQGFSVSVEDVSGQLILYIGPGMFECGSEEEARHLLRLACSSASRLRIEKVGRRVKQWVLERQSGNGWVAALSGGNVCWFSWRASSWIELQNERLQA